MESYSSSYSSSKSSYMSQTSEESKGLKNAYPYQSHSLLHSVRKTPAKSWKKKLPVAPMPPTPVKIYKVDPINFRELVQQLTCAPEFKPSHQPHEQVLQSIENATTNSSFHVHSAPVQNTSIRDTAALTLPIPLPVCTNNWYQGLQSEAFDVNSQETVADRAVIPAWLEMLLFSPTSFSNGCFFPPLSPKIM
ncbi:uncharacterized protein LOC130714169 [Lotus japonicus]|uniref:uncharacterized protein LOC130714169 n=1 Tax=Lotus japonicus TaxID=34305 RepID=UPI002584013E|nr:uncharacterized protein LOC130714169 [Lotus japonicus]